MLKKIVMGVCCVAMPVLALQATEPVDMKNFVATIEAEDYATSRFLNKAEEKGKTYILGKSTSYNKSGEANGGRMVWPYASYEVKSGVAGGEFTVTVHYRVDEELIADKPIIQLGLDLVDPLTVELEDRNKILGNTAKATFKTKILAGKTHTVKVWLGSEGVMIDKIVVRKAIL